MAVLHPVKLTVTNYPEGQSETFEVENNPLDPSQGTHEITFSRHLWIEEEDFLEEPIPKYKRMYPGNEVRLKGAYLVTCTGCKVETSMVDIAREFDTRENRTGTNAPTFQFMRVGFFCLDNKDSTADHLVFNRSVSLRDGFKK